MNDITNKNNTMIIMMMVLLSKLGGVERKPIEIPEECIDDVIDNYYTLDAKTENKICTIKLRQDKTYCLVRSLKAVQTPGDNEHVTEVEMVGIIKHYLDLNNTDSIVLTHEDFENAFKDGSYQPANNDNLFSYVFEKRQ